MILAYLFIRTALGLNIFLHGFSRITGKYQQFVGSVTKEFEATSLNVRVVRIFAMVLPWLELIIGALLLFGLFTKGSAISGFFLLMLLLFGKSIKQDWLTVSLQMIYAFFYVLLIAFLKYNTISIDYFLFN